MHVRSPILQHIVMFCVVYLWPSGKSVGQRPGYFQTILVELQSKLLEQSFVNIHILKGQLACGLASKSVLLTLPLRCFLISTIL
jgi:hypothetical protein